MRIIPPITISTAAGTLFSTNVGTALDPAAYNAGTTYAAGALVVEGLSVYESAVGANTGHLPSTSIPDWWARVGAINSLAMFDTRIGSQTVNPNTITTVVEPGVVADVASLRNVDGSSATITVTDPIAGLVHTETQSLVEPVSNWFEWWFNPVVRKSDAFFLDLPPYRNAAISVTVDNTGGDAKVGALIIGRSFKAGETQYGLSDGITDYSVIRPDAWGVLDIVPRDFSDEVDLTVWVDPDYSARFKRIMTERRTLPTLIIPVDHRPDTQVYGLISWRRTLSYFDKDIFTVTVKGMT